MLLRNYFKVFRVLAVAVIFALAVPLSNPVEVSAAPVTYSTYATSSSTMAYGNDLNYSTARTLASSLGTSSGGLYYAGQNIGYGYIIFRSFLYFNTTSVNPAETISAATLRVWVDNVYGANYNVTIECGNATAPSTYPHDPYVATDFNYTYYTTVCGTANVTLMSLSSYYDIPLNITGIGCINKGGTTTFCLRSASEIAGTTPTGDEGLQFNGALMSYPPQLTLSYDSSTVISTLMATDITATSATLNGFLSTALGNYTLCSFEYGTTTAYGTVTSQQAETTTGTFNYSIPSGLTYATVYHYRAIAFDGNISTYLGQDATFTTLPANGSSTDLIIRSVGIWSGYAVPGDMLICVETQNTYTKWFPNQPAGSVFQIRLLDTDDTTIIAASPLSNWGDKPSSIYLSPAVVAAKIVPQANYFISMVGYGITTNPTVTYNVTAGDMSLGIPSDWHGSDLTTLDKWVIGTALNMQTTDSTLFYQANYISYTTNQAAILSDLGGSYFNQGIPGLSVVRPNLFNTNAITTTQNLGASGDTWTNDTAWTAAVGTGVIADVTKWGIPFGMDNRSVLVDLIIGIILLIVIGSIKAGITPIGLLLMFIPIFWTMTFFQILSPTYLVGVTIICVIAFGAKFGTHLGM